MKRVLNCLENECVIYGGNLKYKEVKPYGREKYVSGGNNWKKDFNIRPKKKFKNWWEDVCDLLPRSTMKANIRKEIQEELINKTIE